MVGETNRLPFDLPEAEGELVSGYMTEYSSMKFAWFFLAEYINMLNVSAVATTLFLGGWRAPWPISAINDGMFNEGWWPVLWFLAKLWVFMFVFVWIRGSVLRFRYDQFMKIGWKVLIPAALVWVVVRRASCRACGSSPACDLRSILFVLAGVVLVGLRHLVPHPREEDAAPDRRDHRARRCYDPYAGGYPVPPLPGQVLPPSPRKQRAAAAAAEADGRRPRRRPTQEVHGG